MTAELKYEGPRGQVGGPSRRPLAEHVKKSSRGRIFKALEAALNEFMMLDEESRSKD